MNKKIELSECEMMRLLYVLDDYPKTHQIYRIKKKLEDCLTPAFPDPNPDTIRRLYDQND